MILDKELRTLYIRARNEYELYLKDLVRDGVCESRLVASLHVRDTHTAVKLTGDPKGGMMHNTETKPWWC